MSELKVLDHLMLADGELFHNSKGRACPAPRPLAPVADTHAHLGSLHGHDPALALDSCDILVVLQGGGVAAVLHPRTDPPAVLQAALAAVYGPLELLPVTDCRGRRRLALLPL